MCSASVDAQGSVLHDVQNDVGSGLPTQVPGSGQIRGMGRNDIVPISGPMEEVMQQQQGFLAAPGQLHACPALSLLCIPALHTCPAFLQALGGMQLACIASEASASAAVL